MARRTVPRKKASYGSVEVSRLVPPKTEGWPKAINIILAFDEALRLQLALQQRLMDINSLNRSTREGRAAGVNLCLYTDARHMTVNAGKVKAQERAAGSRPTATRPG